MSHDEFSALQTMIGDNHVETVQRLASLEGAVKGLPERVTALEQINWRALGARGVVTALWGFLAGLLSTLLVAFGKKLLHP